MKEEIFNLTLGGLVHDIGKIVYRTGKGKNHSDLGADFLENELGISDKKILNQVLYHHVSKLKKAEIEPNDLTYITYIADNISSGVDRRDYEEGVEPEREGYRPIFYRGLALQSVFNVFQCDDYKKECAKEYIMTTEVKGDEVLKLVGKEKYDYKFYEEVLSSLKSEFLKASLTSDYVNSFITMFERFTSYIPSQTLEWQLSDISLFEHSKLTAAIGCCIYEYLKESGYQEDFRFLMKNSKEFYQQNVYMYYTFDISGIQDFIYTIHSDGALKNLRARSFYLEILVEYIVDEILDRSGLSRTNLLYTGGGHAQLLLPNTGVVKQKLRENTEEINKWLRNEFDIKLFMADAFCECCAYDFMLSSQCSFSAKMSMLQDKLQEQKLRRYSVEDIVGLNNNQIYGDRECKVCHRSIKEELMDGECKRCNQFRKISNRILNPETTENEMTKANKQLYVVKEKQQEELKSEIVLPLPYGKELELLDIEEFELKFCDSEYIRVYSKNELYVGRKLETHLWIGDYNRYNTLKETADHSIGIRKIGVLRADVDSLSDAFIQGFAQKHDTLSRKTMLSGNLSLFFKYYINYFLQNGKEKLKEKVSERAITIVYSGGDDIFVIGSWDDIIGFAIDLHNEFEEFTQRKLTLSAGIGMYPEKYPVSQIAYQVGELEECAKMNGKDSVTLFSEEYTFKWERFINGVYKEKYRVIESFYEENEERGISFLYHLLELLQKMEGKDINLARYAFLLARLEPDRNAKEGLKAAYEHFTSKMYEWASCEDEMIRKETIVAIYMYLYVVRKDDEYGE